MSSLTDRIFDSFMEVSKLVCLEDKKRQVKQQLSSVTARRCGNCCHWMRNSCIPEKEHKQFKSINSEACSGFRSESEDLILKYASELAEIQKEIDKIR